MKSIFFGCVLMLSRFMLSAQNDQDTTATRPRTFVLDEMVVSASRWEQNLREVPHAISKINSATVQFQNPQTAADLLAVSDAVFIQKSQLGGGSPMIRGFATNRVLLVVDGVRMNNAIFRSGNVQNVISLDANAIADTEVIFGPGSVLYGSDAIGGVMDFHTIRPVVVPADKQMRVSGAGLIRYGSANHEQTGHIDFNIGMRKWAFLSSLTYAIYDDLRMGNDGPTEYTRPDYVVRKGGVDLTVENPDPNIQVPSGYSQLNAMQKVLFKPNARWDFTYGFHYARSSDYARYDRLLLRREDGNLSSAEWYYGPQQWLMHLLTINNSSPSRIGDHMKLVFALQDYSESRHNRNFQNSRKTNRFEKVQAFSVNLDIDKALTNDLELYYGVEWVTNKVGSTSFRNNIDTGEISPVSTRYPDGSDWRTYAAYISLKYRLNDHWVLNGGGRVTNVYTHADFDQTFYDFPFSEASSNNTAANGSVGVIYNPVTTWKLYGNLTSGFRAPNVDDIGKVFDSEPGNVVVPNPELDAEKSVGIEFGLIGKIDDRLTLDVSFFYTALNNAIARGPTTFNGDDSLVYDGVLSRVLSQQNINQIDVYGTQASLVWDISHSVHLKSAINWQKGQEKDAEMGQRFSPTHVAPLFGSSHLMIEKGKLKTDLYSSYNGEISYASLALSERADDHLYAKDKNGNPYAPAWWTLNLKAAYNISDLLTVNAGVENLFNKRYRAYASGITAPGRNVMVALRFSF